MCYSGKEDCLQVYHCINCHFLITVFLKKNWHPRFLFSCLQLLLQCYIPLETKMKRLTNIKNNRLCCFLEWCMMESLICQNLSLGFFLMKSVYVWICCIFKLLHDCIQLWYLISPCFIKYWYKKCQPLTTMGFPLNI